MRTSSLLRLVLLALGWAVCSTGVQAQNQYAVGDTGSPTTVSEASFGSVMERLHALETSMGEAKKDEKKKDEWVDTSTEKWTIKFAGRVHMDYTNYMSQNLDSFNMFPHGNQGQQDSVEFRRIYLGWEGEGYGVYDWKVELDFADVFSAAGTAGAVATSTTVPAARLKDVYFAINELPILERVQFGHFKIPQSLEVLTSSRYISFVERSLPISAFCPERELGVASFWLAPGENATIGYGVFFDDLNERLKQTLDDRQGVTAVGRATWAPYYEELSNGRYMIHTGASFKYTDARNDTARFRSRPETHLQDYYIDTGDISTDHWDTLGLEGAAVWGPLSVQSEFFYVPVHNNALGVNNDFYGAYVFGSWFLTGENRVYNRKKGVFDRVSPLENFWATRCAGIGHGAWEARARWSYLDLSGTPNALSGVQNDLTLGLTWYWNPNLKWMADYIHSWDVYTSGAAAAAKHPENNILMVSARLDF